MLMTGERERYTLAGLNLFIGVTAVLGGIGLMSGELPIPIELLADSPFTSYAVPGAVLLGVGLVALVGLLALVIGHPLGVPIAAAAGFLMVAYEAVEMLTVGFHLVPPLQPLYVVMGALTMVMAARVMQATPPSRSERTRAAKIMPGHPTRHY
jgi:hypothetical protein